MSPSTPALHRWIKTDCGRAKLAELQQRTGPTARVRLAWFILIAALRDWRLPNPDQSDVSTCLLYTSPSPRDATLSRMPSSA